MKTRLIVSIDPEDKAWLEKESALRGIPMAGVIRGAVKAFRAKQVRPSFRDILAQTAGMWRNGDGLRYQLKVRDEWQ